MKGMKEFSKTLREEGRSKNCKRELRYKRLIVGNSNSLHINRIPLLID